jgi:hypothetical protein
VAYSSIIILFYSFQNKIFVFLSFSKVLQRMLLQCTDNATTEIFASQQATLRPAVSFIPRLMSFMPRTD